MKGSYGLDGSRILLLSHEWRLLSIHLTHLRTLRTFKIWCNLFIKSPPMPMSPEKIGTAIPEERAPCIPWPIPAANRSAEPHGMGLLWHAIKKDPQTWGRKPHRSFQNVSFLFLIKKRSPNMGTKTLSVWIIMQFQQGGNKKRSPNMGTKTCPNRLRCESGCGDD